MERYVATRNLVPVQLVSLYDLRYHLSSSDLSSVWETQLTVRFLDSGRYEVEGPTDARSGEKLLGQHPWTEDLYVESAKSNARAGDIVVSYDDRSLSLVDQIKQSLTLFERIGVQDIKRDLLIHPNGASPDTLSEVIADLAPDIDIVGLTEKDIGFPWFIAASYIRQLRARLDAVLGRYVPIHIFGCFDPQTLPHLFFSGADIFDGLSWMRYYFHNGHAFYDKEFEYDTPPEKLLDPKEAIRSLLGHNVEELERLRADLRYSVLARDLSQFEEYLKNLKAFELAASSQHIVARRQH